jgi:hypothetical protein
MGDTQRAGAARVEGDVDARAAVARLRANAAACAALAADVPAAQARWKPEPEKWSILEVVSHLADEEEEDFRARLDLTLHRPDAAWKPIDPERWAVERGYNEGDLGDALRRFLSSREESVAWLEALEAPDWSQTHQRPRFGPIRAGDLLTSWVAHDHIHIRQLNRLHREYLVASLSRYSPDYAGRW